MNQEEVYPQRLKQRGHRNYVGGEDCESWYGIGKLQYHFLMYQGLEHYHTFLDVACGSLRLGQYLIPILDNHNYYGIDGNEELVKQGLKNEFPNKELLNYKKPNFSYNYNFDFSFSDCQFSHFDFAMAQSLFTHLTLSDIELCFKNIVRKMNQESRFYFTFFEGSSKNNPTIESDPHCGWFYSFEELQFIAEQFNLRLNYIGDWGHPRNQKIVLCKHG